MMEEEIPVRREVEIRAASVAQLQLRLHGFERALALRSGYIMTVEQRCTAAGQYIASIAYELTLPEWLPKARPGASAHPRNHARTGPRQAERNEARRSRPDPRLTSLGTSRTDHSASPEHYPLY
jgi:hypothetical protein